MIRRNIAANLVGRAWGAVSIYLFIPLYLKFLGIEAYGLVAFYSTMLGVLTLADLGLTATLNREMARLPLPGRGNTGNRMGNLIRTYETTYLFISVMVGIVVCLLAGPIARNWLNAASLPPGEIVMAIRLMGVAIALQLPTGLYIGGLMGMQKQVLANVLQIAWGLVRGFGAVLVLWLVSPTILGFTLWQIACNLAYLLAARRSIWKMVPGLPGRYGFRRSVFNETWRYTAGMIGITLVSTVLIQMDKIVVSKMMSLEDFGYYMLASVMAQAPIIIAAPISAAVFPRFTNLASEGARKSLAALYHRTCGLVSAVAIPCGLTLALFSGDFLLAWTGSATAADRAGLTACLLTGGSLCLALQVIPYNLALAYGWTRLNLYLGMASMVIIIPLLIILVGMLGLTGAGMSWMALNVLVIPPYIHYLHKRFLKGEVRRWYLKDIGLPLLAALPVVLIGRWLFPQFHSRPAIFITIGLVGSTAILAAFLAVPELRREIIRKTGRLLAGAHYGT